jgi:hypothetical protein
VPTNAAPEHPHTTTIAASSRLAKRQVTVNHLVVREFPRAQENRASPTIGLRNRRQRPKVAGERHQKRLQPDGARSRVENASPNA